tara:strand:- start:77551 stop:79164 length:1614 start_codon:yes stop_codon:yes gene_type:complete
MNNELLFNKIDIDGTENTLKNIITSYLNKNNLNKDNSSILSKELLGFDYDNDFNQLFEVCDLNELLDVFENVMDKDHRTNNGAIYTPSNIVTKMLELHEIKEDSIILEPSVGNGAFVFKSVDIIRNKYNKSIKDIFSKQIHMNDIDNESLYKLSLLIAVYTLEHQEDIKNDDLNFYNLDFTTIESRSLFNQVNPNIIIGNPPYLSIEKGFVSSEIERYKSDFDCVFKVYDLFAIFIEQSLKTLNDSNSFCFIIPSTFFTNDSFKHIRKLLTEYQIDNLIHLGDDVFKNATVPVCIIKVSKQKKETRKTIIEFNSVVNEVFVSHILGDNSSFRLGIDLDFNNNIVSFQKNKNNTTLGKILEIKEAIKTGNDKRFLSDTPFGNAKPALKGRDVTAFTIKQKLYMDYDKETLSRPHTEAFFEQPKIFIRRVSKNIIAAFDSNNHYSTHTLYCAFDKNKELSNEDYELLTILLNSNFYSKMYETLYPFKGDVFPEIRSTKLKNLIFPNMDTIRKYKSEIKSCLKNNVLNQNEIDIVIGNML